MPNKLIYETSPYLLQHAHNPVDWFPWGEEALQKARTENKPIFLSIGYAACHWCHVMEHESFEDPQTASLLNEHFVSIKVDREERPDLDSIYMNAVVSMTGQGGWPMSLFLTPEGEPFYGGTYFPPERRYGMPAFREVLDAISKSWNSDSHEMRRVGQDVVNHLRETGNVGSTAGQIRTGLLEQAARALIQSYDWQQGAWGKAPRFPQPMAIEFLLMQATRGNDKALEAAEHVLVVMNRGGLYDVVGGGFHRYSTDDAWLVPHFEKMLYDNGLLARAYLHASLLANSPSRQNAFRRVCTETLDFILREMRHPAGGFYSSLDADSEGEEGKYYLWTPEEIRAALPDTAEQQIISQVYLMPMGGNFEGKIILQRQRSLDELTDLVGLSEGDLAQRLNQIHKQLYSVREQRVRPATDDKVLVSWNALTLRALAEAARYLKRTDYLDAARQNADFILREMMKDGHLLRAWRDGRAKHAAYLEDYAGLILALLELYQSDPDPRWYQAALALAEEMQTGFQDPQGGFFDTSSEQSQLIVRPKDVQDNAIPSGSAQACGALLRLAAYDERADWRTQAESMLSGLQELLVRHPTAFSFWLQDLDFAVGPVQQIAILSAQLGEAQPMLDLLWQTYRPRTVVAAGAASGAAAGTPGLLHERGLRQDKPTAYVCEGFVCKLPVNTLEGLQQQLV